MKGCAGCSEVGQRSDGADYIEWKGLPFYTALSDIS
jgi:hypothetical protein